MYEMSCFIFERMRNFSALGILLLHLRQCCFQTRIGHFCKIVAAPIYKHYKCTQSKLIFMYTCSLMYHSLTLSNIQKILLGNEILDHPNGGEVDVSSFSASKKVCLLGQLI